MANQSIELYRFDNPDKNYYFNNGNTEFTYQGNIYKPISINRTDIFQTTAKKRDEQFTLTNFPLENELIQDVIHNRIEGKTSLIVFEYDGSRNANVLSRGFISGYNINRDLVDVVIDSHMKNMLDREIPNLFWQKSCQHRFGDKRCKADTARVTITTKIAEITTADNTANKAIRVESLSGVPALGGRAPDNSPDRVRRRVFAGIISREVNVERNYFLGGIIRRVSDGKVRQISAQNSETPEWLTLNRPFLNLNVGDEIQLTAGCAKTKLQCLRKHGNLDNYGGFDVPNISLRERGVRTPRTNQIPPVPRTYEIHNGRISNRRIR